MTTSGLFGPYPVQWTCHICGRMRNDADIAVHSHSMPDGYGLPGGTVKLNVRYCRDNDACVRAAPTYIFFNKDKN